VAGTSINGVKSALFIADTLLPVFVNEYCNFIKDLKVSFLVFMYSEKNKINITLDIPIITLFKNTYKQDLITFNEKISKHKCPGVVIIKKGAVS